MTSHFDNLMRIGTTAMEDAKFKDVADWLFDICIEQANTKKVGWNFETWKQRSYGLTIIKLYGDEVVAKQKFLNCCHDVLDHNGGWHLKVFDPQTAQLISILADVVEGRKDIYDVDKIKKKFKRLPDFLLNLGYRPTDKNGWMWTSKEELRGG